MRQQPDADAGLDEPARRLEVADLDARLDLRSQLARPLVQEGVDRARLVQAHVVVVERVGEVDRITRRQRMPGRHRQHSRSCRYGSDCRPSVRTMPETMPMSVPPSVTARTMSVDMRSRRSMMMSGCVLR